MYFGVFKNLNPKGIKKKGKNFNDKYLLMFFFYISKQSFRFLNFINVHFLLLFFKLISENTFLLLRIVTKQLISEKPRRISSMYIHYILFNRSSSSYNDIIYKKNLNLHLLFQNK